MALIDKDIVEETLKRVCDSASVALNNAGDEKEDRVHAFEMYCVNMGVDADGLLEGVSEFFTSNLDVFDANVYTDDFSDFISSVAVLMLRVYLSGMLAGREHKPQGL